MATYYIINVMCNLNVDSCVPACFYYPQLLTVECEIISVNILTHGLLKWVETEPHT